MYRTLKPITATRINCPLARSKRAPRPRPYAQFQKVPYGDLERAHALVIGILDDQGHPYTKGDGTLGIHGSSYIDQELLESAYAPWVESVGPLLTKIIPIAAAAFTDNKPAVKATIAAIQVARQHNTSEAFAAYKGRLAFLAASTPRSKATCTCALCGGRKKVVPRQVPHEAAPIPLHSGCEPPWRLARAIVSELVVYLVLQRCNISPGPKSEKDWFETMKQTKERLAQPPVRPSRLADAAHHRLQALPRTDRDTHMVLHNRTAMRF